MANPPPPPPKSCNRVLVWKLMFPWFSKCTYRVEKWCPECSKTASCMHVVMQAQVSCCSEKRASRRLRATSFSIGPHQTNVVATMSFSKLTCFRNKRLVARVLCLELYLAHVANLGWSCDQPPKLWLISDITLHQQSLATKLHSKS